MLNRVCQLNFQLKILLRQFDGLVKQNKVKTTGYKKNELVALSEEVKLQKYFISPKDRDDYIKANRRWCFIAASTDNY